ncbi:MAG: PQQ-dependent sugar dehydrogenase [Rhodospirillales bacterium]
MHMTRQLAALAAAGALISAAAAADAADYPPGFSDQLVASGLARPTAMAFAPDNRLFVTEQGGTLRVVKNDVRLATPFVSLTVDSRGERGLLGVAFDPAFASNRFVYVYHTVPGSPPHNRVTRFTANGDRAVAGSGRVILDLPPLGAATNHNGGALEFGPDGKLYVFVGENGNGANSQVLTNRLGKVLRINKDGTIPGDNPRSFPGISGTTSGIYSSIWAVGLRNPFTAAFQPTIGRLFINDVGANSWEEINPGRRGANYGWPRAEGASSNPNYTDPVHQYVHVASGPSVACAIAGGVFYNPPVERYPSFYRGKYFYADLCGGWIHYIDAANPGNGGFRFASGIGSPVALEIGDGGMINYLTRQGQIRRITYNR